MKAPEMKKVVKEGGKWYTEQAKQLLGEEVGRLANGRVVIQAETGEERIACYGTMDERGKFLEFCSDTGMICGARCPWAGKGCCRYNKKIQEHAGYYMSEDEMPK